MKILERITSRLWQKSEHAPLQDEILGELQWDDDIEAWTGTIMGPDGPAQLLVLSGSVRDYPDPELLNILHTPGSRFEEFVHTAREFLRNALTDGEQSSIPDELAAQGLEIYQQHLTTRTFLITFVHDDSEAIWTVFFQDNVPNRYEVDF